LLWGLAIAAIVIALVLVAGVLYQALGAAADLRRYPPPGRLIDIGGYRLHLLSAGSGSPTVVLDSGLPGSVLSWVHVQPELARLVRVVSYDRAGLGWSDTGPKPRTAGRIANELHSLLERAGVAPPYVLVGHSFGALTARLFTARYPQQVCGLVLVDPVGPGEWMPLTDRERLRLAGGSKLCRRTALLARFGVCRLVSLLVRLGAHRAAQAAVLVISEGVLADARSTIGPIAKLSADQRARVRMFWVLPKFYDAMAGQLESLPNSAAQVAAASRSFGAMPVVVLSASNADPARLAEQVATARLSSCGRHIIASGSSHWIQLDQPELVVGAVIDVLAQFGGVAPPPPTEAVPPQGG
jgi:pimeloyl-ACP methyl ester carboxylesterase